MNDAEISVITNTLTDGQHVYILFYTEDDGGPDQGQGAALVNSAVRSARAADALVVDGKGSRHPVQREYK